MMQQFGSVHPNISKIISAHDWHTGHTQLAQVWTKHTNINQKQWLGADSTFYADAQHMNANNSMGLQKVQ